MGKGGDWEVQLLVVGPWESGLQIVEVPPSEEPPRPRSQRNKDGSQE